MARFNAESLRLMRHLDGLAAEDAGPATQDMSRFAAQAAAAHAAQASESYTSRVGDLFSWVENKVLPTTLIKAAVAKATTLGLATPLVKDIAGWQSKVHELHAMKLRFDSAVATQLPHILNMKNAKADLFYQSMSTNIRAAQDHIDNASSLCGKAMAAAQEAKTAIGQGGIPVQLTSIYL